MPPVRQPLCKRCNIQLSVVTSISDSDIYYGISKNRGRPQKRQRKVTIKRKFKSPHHSFALAYDKGENPIAAPSSLPLPHSRGIHLQAFCEIIPFLSIALSDGLFDPSTLLPPTTSVCVVPFTHFIRVQYQTPLLKPGFAWSEYHVNTGISVLNLIVPEPRPRGPGQEDQKQTFLSEHQLLLSRDFLSLALPYYCQSNSPKWTTQLPSADMVHVLITAPPGPSGSIDVMSIIACYLTFAGGETTTAVVKCVDSEMDALELDLVNVWKGRVKVDGVKVIQRVAIAP